MQVVDYHNSPVRVVVNVSCGTLSFPTAPTASALSSSETASSETASIEGVSRHTYKSTSSISLSSHTFASTGSTTTSVVSDLTSLLHSMVYTGPRNHNFDQDGAISVTVSLLREVATGAGGAYPGEGAHSGDVIAMTVALMSIDDAPTITMSASSTSNDGSTLVGTTTAPVYFSPLSIADIDTQEVSLLLWLPLGETVVVYGSGSVDPSSGLYVANITSSNTTATASREDTEGMAPSLFVHGTVVEVNLALRSLLHISTRVGSPVLSTDYITTGLVTALNTSTTVIVNDVLSSYDILAAQGFTIRLSAGDVAGSVSPFDTTLIVYEDSNGTSLESIQLYNYGSTVPTRVTLSIGEGGLLSTQDIIADDSVEANLMLRQCTFTTVQHYNGILILNVSISTMDVRTRVWSKSMLMKSNKIPILPVNDPPTVHLDATGGGGGEIVCLSNSSCIVAIVLNDVDVDEYFSPLEFDKHYKVQIASNVTGVGISLPTDGSVVGLTGIYPVAITTSSSDQETVMEFYGSMATLSNQSLSLFLSNSSMAQVERDDVVYVEMTVTVFDEGCCGRYPGAGSSTSNGTTLTVNVAYMHTGEVMPETSSDDSTTTTSSQSNNITTELSYHDVVCENVHLTYDSTITLDRISNENRQVLQGKAYTLSLLFVPVLLVHMLL